MVYNYNNVPRDTKVWACAYSTNGTEKSMALSKRPVLGIVVGDKNHWTGAKFYEIGRNGEIKKSSRVWASARVYADTFEECAREYNSRVKHQIDFLESLKQKCLSDMIEFDYKE